MENALLWPPQAGSVSHMDTWAPRKSLQRKKQTNQPKTVCMREKALFISCCITKILNQTILLANQDKDTIRS